jgi:hypothetical protein
MQRLSIDGDYEAMRLPVPFRLRGVERMAPGVGRPIMDRVRKSLRERGKTRLQSKGRDVSRERVEEDGRGYGGMRGEMP